MKKHSQKLSLTINSTIGYVLLAAILTNPYTILVFCDIYNAIGFSLNAQYDVPLVNPHALTPLSVLSFTLFVIVLAMGAIYVVRRAKK